MTSEEKTQFQQAVEYVAFWSEACLPPSLDTVELETIVTGAQVASIWLPNTAYNIGDHVTADPPNGVVYTCTTAGTTGATQPVWPAFSVTGCGCSSGGAVTDGTSGWVATGTASGLFDTQKAVFDAWMKKSAKATVLIQNSSFGQSQASQQLFTHISMMCARWQATEVS